METYSNEEMADMHMAYGEAQGNSRQAAILYRNRFPNRNVPNIRTFTAIHRRLRETGSFKVTRPDAGRKRLNFELEQEVLEHFEEHPTASCRSAAHALGIRSHATVWNVLNKNGLHPFRYQKVQGLLPADYPHRVNFSRWYLNKIRYNRQFSSSILFTDEATFTREGIFNHHNRHHWTEQNPHNIIEQNHQHRFSVNVWAGILGNHLIGPYIFPATLNGNTYNAFLLNTLPLLLEDVTLNVRRSMWYQQDGAPPHFSRAVRDTLNIMFPRRWVGRRGPVNWPARSPDLTPLDFFLWGHMKSVVYETTVDSEEDLIARIVVAAGDIAEKREVFERVWESLEKRCRLCIEEDGKHFEQML